jgi:hypothetical protein
LQTITGSSNEFSDINKISTTDKLEKNEFMSAGPGITRKEEG